MGYIYFIASGNGQHIKIGYTKNHPSKRLKQLATGSHEQLYLLGYMHGTNDMEKELHRMFHRVNLEWFFATPDLVDYINNNNEMFVTVDWLDKKLYVFKKMKMVTI